MKVSWLIANLADWRPKIHKLLLQIRVGRTWPCDLILTLIQIPQQFHVVELVSYHLRLLTFIWNDWSGKVAARACIIKGLKSRVKREANMWHLLNLTHIPMPIQRHLLILRSFKYYTIFEFQFQILVAYVTSVASILFLLSLRIPTH